MKKEAGQEQMETPVLLFDLFALTLNSSPLLKVPLQPSYLLC